MDIYELVQHQCGLDEDADYDAIHESLYEKYEIEMHNLEKIIKDLLPLIDVGVSPITNLRFKGFSVSDGENGFLLVKIEVNQ